MLKDLEYVAEILLFAFDGKSDRVPFTLNYGHSFVVIKNLSNTNIYINNYCLSPNNICSISSWTQSIHFGVWYNIELEYLKLGRYKGRISIRQKITNDQLILIGDVIKNNDKWTLNQNCARLSLDIFNACIDKKIEAKQSIKPKELYKIIYSFKEKEQDVEFNEPHNSVGFFAGDTFHEFKLKEENNE